MAKTNDPRPGSDSIDTHVVRSRPSGRQVGAGILVVVLLVFIASNSDSTQISMLGASVELPLWVVLAATALVGFGIGMVVGSRRAKARLRRK